MPDENDDLLNPDEIEELLKSGSANHPASQPDSAESAEDAGANADSAPDGDSDDDGDLLDPSEIESLLEKPEGGKKRARGSSPAEQGGSTDTERLLDQAEADLAAAVDPDLAGAEQFDFPEFESDAGGGDPNVGLDALQDVELDLKIELGRAELLIEEVLQLKEGSVVPLDKLAGDPVDVIVNGRLIARGEVLVLNDNFCVRIAEILTPEV